MAKLTINCGDCGDRKQCAVRKNFIEFVELNYKGKSYTDDLKIFTLKCPFKTSKFKEGVKVRVTIGVGRYSVTHVHECLISEDEYSAFSPCNGCKFADKCKDSEVTHVNTRYKEFIEIDAEIIGAYKKGRAQVLKIDYQKIKHLLNGRDQVFLNKINESLDHTFDQYDSDLDEFRDAENGDFFYIISKNKFIKLIKQ